MFARLPLLITLLLGCPSKTPPAGGPPAPPTGDSAGVHTADTADTTATEPWGPPVAPWAVFQLNFRGEPPYDTWEDGPNYITGVQAMPDVTGDGKPDLIVYRYDGSEIRSGLPIQAEIDLRDGIDAKFFRSNPAEFSFAGDINQDGVGDLWHRDCLHLGPLDSMEIEGDLCLNIYNPSTDAVTFGDIDADGDGVLDIIMTSSVGWLGIAYGPFNDGRTLDDPRHAENTTFGPRGSCFGQNDSTYIGPANDLDQRLVAVSGYTDCPPLVIDAAGPRGRVIEFSEIITQLTGTPDPLVRNLRQDGLVDVSLSGQLVDDVNAYAQGEPPQQIFQARTLTGGIGDLTGDGRDEMISVERVERPPNNEEDWLWYVVPGRPDLDNADATTLGVHLGGYYDNECDDFTSIDLDDDGRSEVICWGHRRMVMWRGIDIRDALVAAGKLPSELSTP